MTTTAPAPAPDLTASFPAGMLARGWLSVALASGKDAARPALDGTVAVELYPTGARLTATDGYVLLSAWVPHADDQLGDPPGFDEIPTETLVAIDSDGRAKGLLAHGLALASAKDAPPIDVRLSAGTFDPDALTLTGLDGPALVITLESSAGGEELRLRTYEGEWVDWRSLLAGFKAETTDAVALSPDIVGRLSKLAKYHDGPLVWHFGGADRMAKIEMADPLPPRIEGVVMPVRLGDEPAPRSADEEDDDYEERLRSSMERDRKDADLDG